MIRLNHFIYKAHIDSIVDPLCTDTHIYVISAGALIQVCELEKNADAAGNAVWNLDRKLIAEDTLRALLADFPEDVLLNLGITPGTAGTLDPAAFGLEPRPITTDPAWPADPVSPETQQTDPSQPGPDDIVNG